MQGDECRKHVSEQLLYWLEDQSKLEPKAPNLMAKQFQIRSDVVCILTCKAACAVPHAALSSFCLLCRRATDIPSSSAAVDSGVFVMKYAASLVSKQPMDFSQKDSMQLRHQIHASLQSLQEHCSEALLPTLACIADQVLLMSVVL